MRNLDTYVLYLMKFIPNPFPISIAFYQGCNAFFAVLSLYVWKISKTGVLNVWISNLFIHYKQASPNNFIHYYWINFIDFIHYYWIKSKKSGLSPHSTSYTGLTQLKSSLIQMILL